MTEERKRRRWGRALLILLFIVIVLIIAADRVGVLVAEHAIAGQARDQLAAQQISTSEPPSVTVRGVPFLTQVAAGHYREIDIDLVNPTSRGVRLDTLDVVATDVTAPTSGLIGGDATITAGKVAGVVHLSWQSFQQLVDLSGLRQYGVDPETLRIEPASDGKIRISAPVTVLGATFTAVAIGAVTIVADVVHISISSIDTAGSQAPPGASQELNRLKNQLTFNIKVPPLPYHLTVDGITTTSSGVRIDASARDVTLAGN